MKKLLLVLFAVTIKVSLFGQTTTTALFSTTGMAPIPSFIKKEPTSQLFLSMPIGKYVTFEPDYAFSLQNGKPWFADIWTRFNLPLDTAKHAVLTFGVDPSLFFQDFQKGDKTTMQIVPYPTIEARLRYTINAHNVFTFDNQYMAAIPSKYGSRGLYSGATYSGSIETKVFTFTAMPTVFYLNFSDGTKGFGSAADISVLHKKTGISIGYQTMKPLSFTSDSAHGLYLAITKTW